MTQLPYIGHILTRKRFRVDQKKGWSYWENAGADGCKSYATADGVGELSGEVRAASVNHHAAPQTTPRQGQWVMLVAYSPAGIRLNEENLTMTPALEYYDLMKSLVILIKLCTNRERAASYCFRMWKVVSLCLLQIYGARTECSQTPGSDL